MLQYQGGKNPISFPKQYNIPIKRQNAMELRTNDEMGLCIENQILQQQ
jgi:hypothetical protein